MHTSCSARADTETPQSDIKHTSFMAEACLNGTVGHFIFFWKYCDSADIITEHPAHKVISVRYTKAKKTVIHNKHWQWSCLLKMKKNLQKSKKIFAGGPAHD